MLGVADQQVQRRAQPRRGDVARPVDAQAVAGMSAATPRGRAVLPVSSGQMPRQQPRHELQALQAPPDAQQPPAGILRHVIQREPRQRRQRQQQPVERLARRFTAADALVQLLLQDGDRPPAARPTGGCAPARRTSRGGRRSATRPCGIASSFRLVVGSTSAATTSSSRHMRTALRQTCGSTRTASVARSSRALSSQRSV